MAIVKAKQKEYHARVPNETARDKNLSLEAKGLLCVLLSLDENWVVYKKQLTDFSTNKYHSTSRAFNELIDNGYIFDRGRSRSEKGNLQENIYEVYAEKQRLEQIEPNRDFQDLDNPSPENPTVENQHLSNTIINNSKYNKKEIEYGMESFDSTGTISPSSNATSKKKPKKFTPPTEEDVINYFLEKGYTEESAKKAFQYYDEGNWKDASGRQVKNWKQKMIGVWFKDENKIKSTTLGFQSKMIY